MNRLLTSALSCPKSSADVQVRDFRIPRVRSINASGHKFGLAPLRVGWVIWREEKDLPEELVFWVNYLGSQIIELSAAVVGGGNRRSV